MIHTSASPGEASPVLVVMGSTRPSRICPKIASWVIDIAHRSSPLRCELVDLNEWPLPADEPEIPARGMYVHEHTRAWSRKIVSASAVIFVTPQYNWGYPAPLKNAIDHLYKEWGGKPSVIITYGGHGGNKCAVQLRQVLEATKARVVDTMPGITLSEAMIHGGPVDPEADFGSHLPSIEAAVAELASIVTS